MRIFYISADGQKFDFSTLSDAPTPRIARLKTADFHRWEYTPDGVERQLGFNLAGFRRTAAEYEAQLYIFGSTYERDGFLKTFHAAAMHDAAMKTPGTLTWGDWQIEAYVVYSDTYPLDGVEHVTVNDVRFYCPYPRWMMSDYFEIKQGKKSMTGDYNASTFPFDFPFIFAFRKAPTDQIIQVRHHIPSDFELTINGPVTNPRLTIGKMVYGVNATIPPLMSVTIKSRTHEVLRSDGLNLFGYRTFENSVFEKINPGNLTVKRSDDFSATLKLWKESDEPTWNLYSQM
jgi:hypothetical protein